MAELDRHVKKDQKIPLKHIVVPIITAISQTGVVSFKFTPGYAFRVMEVKTYCLLKAGTVTAQPKVGGRACTAAVAAFTTATENTPGLHATDANLIGSSSEAITLEYTTDGSGVLTNGFMVITIRPRGLKGDN